MAILGGTRGFMLGFTVGFGAGVMARDYLPAVRTAARPATKIFLRGGMKMMEKARETMARVGEAFQDIAAEVSTELRSEREPSVSPKAAHGSKTKRKAKHGKASTESQGAVVEALHERRMA
jgi:hypothetical protein